MQQEDRIALFKLLPSILLKNRVVVEDSEHPGGDEPNLYTLFAGIPLTRR